MGFFNKAWNFMRGKGWKDNDIQEQPVFDTVQEEQLKKVEDTQYKKPDIVEDVEQKDLTEQFKQEIADIKREEDKIESLDNIEEQRAQQNEFNKVVKKFESSPKVSEFTSGLNNEVVNSQSIMPTSNLGQLKPIYSKLLTENGKLNDPDILDILIENRMKLQHRFSAEFILVGAKNGEIARMPIQGSLIVTGKQFKYLK